MTTQICYFHPTPSMLFAKKMSYPCAVFPEEVDYFVESLRRYQVVDIGCENWFQQNDVIVKLTQQAFIEASSKQEEIIKEKIVVESKLPVIVHEMYCILIWRVKILPLLIDKKDVQTSFVLYSVLYYEVNIVALLETLLFHQSCCEGLGETALDLIDYCAQAMGQVIGFANNKEQGVADPNELLKERSADEIERLKRDIEFKVGLKCVTILSYLINNITVLPLSAVNRVTKTHDVPCLIAEILHVKPWLRKTRAGFEKFLEGGWTIVHGEDILKVTKDEAQAWFCLYGILFNEELMQNYEVSEFRKKQIGKCMGLLNDHILDQVPVLTQLKQYLCTFQIDSRSTRPHQSKLLLDDIPEIKQKLMTNAEKYGFDKIVQRHKTIFVDLSQAEIENLAKKLSASYNTDILEKCTSKDLMNQQKKCFSCGQPAEKKCSKCECTYYCSRDCQVTDWMKHKELCHHLKTL